MIKLKNILNENKAQLNEAAPGGYGLMRDFAPYFDKTIKKVYSHKATGADFVFEFTDGSKVELSVFDGQGYMLNKL